MEHSDEQTQIYAQIWVEDSLMFYDCKFGMGKVALQNLSHPARYGIGLIQGVEWMLGSFTQIWSLSKTILGKGWRCS